MEWSYSRFLFQSYTIRKTNLYYKLTHILWVPTVDERKNLSFTSKIFLAKIYLTWSETANEAPPGAKLLPSVNKWKHKNDIITASMQVKDFIKFYFRCKYVIFFHKKQNCWQRAYMIHFSATMYLEKKEEKRKPLECN